ncbi:MAG TPA: TonB-dependent receptor [Parafilimonas sp.]|nr:TonB-dependent receptor [Parafilimonas sp.]
MTSLELRFLTALLLITQTLIAQNRTITGKIIDASTHTPLSNVSVKIKNSGMGAVTKADGGFSVTAQPGDVIEISYVGYTMQTVTVGDQSFYSVELQPAFTELGEVVLVGSRSGGRIKTETTVPIDVVNVSRSRLPSARMGITDVLNYAAPSFNYNKQSGSDGADHIDLATLRGLGPDQTLVLVNGKRRHQTAFVAVFGTRGRGNSGTDLNAIPVSSIDRVEILRDGASAQYGSDAIAGVINIILKKDVGHFTGNVGWSGYYDKKYNPHFFDDDNEYYKHAAIDGNAFDFNADYGFSVGKNGGFFNLAGSVVLNGKTFRQDNGTLPINSVRRANGDGSMTDAGAMFNMEIPLNANSKTSFYAFGGYNYNLSNAYAFTRNFSARPDRFPTGNYDPSTNSAPLIFNPEIMKTNADEETYYNPIIQTHISDASLAAGIKGTTAGGWNWDLSNAIGNNDFHFYGDKTFNASLGPDQTHFDDGGFTFLQNTTDLNFSKKISGVGAGFNLAFGAEFRYEDYKIKAGEEGSYKTYGSSFVSIDSVFDDDQVFVGLDTTFKAGGSQGFPGYQPGDVVDANRTDIGAYIDAEFDVTKAFLIAAAIRAEDYSDFGFTSNYKLAMRYKVAPKFNLRGSVSTGFRAPSLQQINYSSTFTTVQGGVISEVKIAPNYSDLAKAAGIPNLTQEKSVTASLGFAFTPTKELTITVDGYYVKIKDRVVLSGQFDATDPTLDEDLTNALQNANVAYAQFFANAVNTTNKGVDIVIDYNHQWSTQHFRALFTGNFQNMTIDQINVPEKLNDTKQHQETFLSDREQKFILASAPPGKFSLNLDYTVDKFGIGTRFTYFGRVILLGYGEDGSGIDPMVPTDADENVYVPDQYNYGAKVVTDLYLSYRLAKAATLYVGADNLLNVHPDLGYAHGASYWAFNNETGGPFDAVQMGQNGMHLFARLGINF